MVKQFRFIVCCLLLVTGGNIYSQDSLTATHPSLISFPADLDSVAVDSFCKIRNIDLAGCKTPELYFEIYRWYRTCYRYGGNTSKGIDCSHFVNMLWEKLYGKRLNSSSGSIFTQCKIVKGGFSEAVEGDLIFFKIKRKRISHIAIYLQNGKFAHATTQAGVIISSISEPYYKRHFYKVGRLE